MFTSRQETLSCLCCLKEQQQCCLESLDLSFPTRFIILESELITGTIVPIQLTQTWIFGSKLIFLFSCLFVSFLMSLSIPIIPEPFHSFSISHRPYCKIWKPLVYPELELEPRLYTPIPVLRLSVCAPSTIELRLESHCLVFFRSERFHLSVNKKTCATSGS